ncbi:hypothetical protein TNCT_334061, partial [Trichonephila clavata]
GSQIERHLTQYHVRLACSTPNERYFFSRRNHKSATDDIIHLPIPADQSGTVYYNKDAQSSMQVTQHLRSQIHQIGDGGSLQIHIPVT